MHLDAVIAGTASGGDPGRDQPPPNLEDAEEDLKMYARRRDPGQTWVEADGATYGAVPDERGPIGGGEGYSDIIIDGDYRVSGLDELLEVLATASAGQVVFIDGAARIDLTTRVHIDELVLEVPEGVTLASDRGQGGSRGAMICSEVFATRPLIRAAGADVRIAGLRLRGPDPERRIYHHNRSFGEGRGHEYYYRFPISEGIHSRHSGMTVDNCELAGWSHSAVYLKGSEGHLVHHNFIHHNQYQGLGYGVCLDKAAAVIRYNLFDFNRHSIAGTGRPGTSYEASHNVELGESLGHCFDMHGGGDRQDGTDTAGTRIDIHHNTFRAAETPIVIRGTPEGGCRVHGNWFPKHSKPGDGSGAPAVSHRGGVAVEENHYGD